MNVLCLITTPLPLLVLVVCTCFVGCLSWKPTQSELAFTRDNNGYPVAMISGAEFYKVVDYASTNRLAMQAAISKMLMQNEHQYIIVLESFIYGGYAADVNYEWVIIAGHEQVCSSKNPFKGEVYLAENNLVNLVCEQILNSPEVETIPEPALLGEDYFVAFSIYNGKVWKQVKAINPWYVFRQEHLHMDVKEEVVAMRITFALLASFQVKGVLERCGGTYRGLNNR